MTKYYNIDGKYSIQSVADFKRFIDSANTEERKEDLAEALFYICSTKISGWI